MLKKQLEALNPAQCPFFTIFLPADCHPYGSTGVRTGVSNRVTERRCTLQGTHSGNSTHPIVSCLAQPRFSRLPPSPRVQAKACNFSHRRCGQGSQLFLIIFPLQQSSGRGAERAEEKNLDVKMITDPGSWPFPSPSPTAIFSG